MTSDRQFDTLLRSWLEESAPSGQPQDLLESVVTATGHIRPRPGWLVGLRGAPMPETGRPGLNRFAPLTLAATALVIAILIGIGLLLRSPNFGPSPVPGPTHSSTAQPTTHPASAAWTVTGSVKEGRSQPSATLLNDGKVLVAGGLVPLGGTTSAELYDPASGTWTTTGNMLTADYGFATALLDDGRVLAVHNGSGTAELYDPASGTWTATGNMVTGHTWGTATLLPDGSVLVAGDNFSSGADPVTAELYDPNSGTWTATAGMVTPRIFHMATLLADGRVLVAGGAAGADGKTRLATAELYDPSSRTWTATGNMVVARGNSSQAFTITLLTDGRVLAVGGENPDGTGLEASAELYDPNNGTWSLAGSMSDGRTVQTATLLRDGRVLVTGGFTGHATDPTASAELYDPNSGPLVEFGIGSWSVTASMVEARDGHMAILLLDGRVLVVGGSGRAIFNEDTQVFDTPLLYSGELYDPGSGS